MRPSAFASIVAVFLVVLLAGNAAVADDTLCHQSEEIVFSCPVAQGKTVSVCALSDSNVGNKITYRFGELSKADIQITADLSGQQSIVEYNQETLARAYDIFVRFKFEKYAHVVQQRWNGCPTDPEDSCGGEDSFFAGVLVYESGKKIARRECSGPRKSLDYNILNRLRVPTSERWPK